ncbi:MAG: GNAT family N-acetyltransferase [Bacteroidia bacterium]
MKIIPATTDHLPILVPLFEEYRTFYRQEADAEAAHTFLQTRMNQKESAIFIAVADQTCAGFTQLYPIFSSLGMNRRWLLNDLYVSHDFRNMGIGTLLLEAAKDWGRATGAGALVLETEVTNVGAQRLYEKNGWKRDVGFFWYHFKL